MRERVQDLITTIGFNHNDVQVIEGDSTFTLMFPNYFEAQEFPIDEQMPERDLVNMIEDVVVDHMINIKQSLEMISRFKEIMNYEEEDN